MRRSLLFVALLLILACQSSFAAPAQPATDPSGQGKPLLTPTVTVITCHMPAIPKDAILAPNTVYPDPETCNANPTGDLLSHRRASTVPDWLRNALPAPAPASPILPQPSSWARPSVPASVPAAMPASSGSTDQQNGFSLPNQSLKAGYQADMSVLIPTYFPYDSRVFDFYNPLIIAANRDCLYVTSMHERNNAIGNIDQVGGWDFCANTGYWWSMYDSVAVAQLVRDDQYSDPIVRLVNEQTSLVTACFTTRIFNFTYNAWTNINSSCQNTVSNLGQFTQRAGPMETPTLYCPTANFNAYAANILKKNGSTWAQPPLTDFVQVEAGHCTTGNGGTWYPSVYVQGGATVAAFIQ